ncbi:hypothetical protein SGLAM104S_01190 [Streptomyces glaucescens]
MRAAWKALCRASDTFSQQAPSLAVRDRAVATWSASARSPGTRSRHTAAASASAGTIQLFSA